MADLKVKISELPAGTPTDAAIVPFVEGGITKRATKADLKGAKGDTGDTGATGAQGPQGEQGPQGTQGAQGPAGADGADGQGYTWRGAYSAGTAYVPYDTVSYNGSSYVCKQNSTGNFPTNATYWDPIALKGDAGAQGAQGPQGETGPQGPAGSGSGDVLGPATHPDSYLAQWDGADTKTLKAGINPATLAAETPTSIGALINGATEKTTPVDADQVGLMDSAAANILKKLSWANIKATLKTYFDTLYAATGHNHSGTYQPADAELDTWSTKTAPTGSVVGTTDTQTLSGKTLTKPIVNGSTPGVSSYTPSAAGTATLDLSNANVHAIQMPAGNITIALSNVSTGQLFVIEITQDSGGSRTVTWFSTIKWAGGSAPTLTTAANKRDTFIFRCTGSDTYDGFIVGQNI